MNTLWHGATQQIAKRGLSIQPLKFGKEYHLSLTYKNNKDFSLIINKKDGGSIWMEKTWRF